MEPWSHQRKCCDHQSRNVGGPQKLEESAAISEGIKVLLTPCSLPVKLFLDLQFQELWKKMNVLWF